MREKQGEESEETNFVVLGTNLRAQHMQVNALWLAYTQATPKAVGGGTVKAGQTCGGVTLGRSDNRSVAIAAYSQVQLLGGESPLHNCKVSSCTGGVISCAVLPPSRVLVRSFISRSSAWPCCLSSWALEPTVLWPRGRWSYLMFLLNGQHIRGGSQASGAHEAHGGQEVTAWLSSTERLSTTTSCVFLFLFLVCMNVWPTCR